MAQEGPGARFPFFLVLTALLLGTYAGSGQAATPADSLEPLADHLEGLASRTQVVKELQRLLVAA